MDHNRFEQVAGYGTFVVLVVVFFAFGGVALTRALGVVVALGGAYNLRRGSIPYGIEGRAPSGHITGLAAKILSAAIITLGLLVAVKATEAACLLGWAQSSGCA